MVDEYEQPKTYSAFLCPKCDGYRERPRTSHKRGKFLLKHTKNTWIMVCCTCHYTMHISKWRDVEEAKQDNDIVVDERKYS